MEKEESDSNEELTEKEEGEDDELGIEIYVHTLIETLFINHQN